MRRFPVLLCAPLLVYSIALFASTEDKGEKSEEFKLTVDERAVIDFTNAERKKAEKELKPLKTSPKLTEAARKHAANMAEKDMLEHVLDEKTPADRIKAAGYKYQTFGENIAWNAKTPKAALEGWMKSEGHRENILNPDYEEIGVAVAKNKKGEPYWVQVFGKQ